MRAINSVVEQTYVDWELIVIDDGSTDSTSSLNLDIDPRIRVIHQDNKGVSGARNSGLKASRGSYIAFLDSDDEWLPHFLKLSVGFLKAFPTEQYVTVEFFLGSSDIRGIRHAISHTYLQEARRIGSHALDLPVGESDDYMRVYEARQQLGKWAERCLTGVDVSRAFIYQGNVFKYTRWGYFAWLPSTVLTRYALEKVGLFDDWARTGEDYPFQATLARYFRTHLISLPSARKHERGIKKNPLKEDHLATGSRNAFAFRVNRLKYFDLLHWRNRQDDVELSLIRKDYVYHTGKIALELGLRREAMKCFKEAACFKFHLWRAYVLRIFAFICLTDNLTALTSRIWDQVATGIARLFYKTDSQRTDVPHEP